MFEYKINEYRKGIVILYVNWEPRVKYELIYLLSTLLKYSILNIS